MFKLTKEDKIADYQNKYYPICIGDLDNMGRLSITGKNLTILLQREELSGVNGSEIYYGVIINYKKIRTRSKLVRELARIIKNNKFLIKREQFSNKADKLKF